MFGLIFDMVLVDGVFVVFVLMRGLFFFVQGVCWCFMMFSEVSITIVCMRMVFYGFLSRSVRDRSYFFVSWISCSCECAEVLY